MSPDRVALAPAQRVTVDRQLWFSVFGGAVAWALAAGAGYVVASRTCAAGLEATAGWSVSALGLVALGVSAAGVVSAWRRWHVAREHRRFMAGARSDDVGAFLAWAGAAASGLAALGSLFILIAPFFLTPCAHTW